MLKNLLDKNKKTILKRWSELVFATYSPETAQFLAKQSNEFANPVGAAITGATAGIFDWIMDGAPVEKELDLKLSASAVGEKSVEMIHVKDINQITGYIRGGCSPIGMKKQFPTVIDSSAESKETITVSGGKIGTQVELSPADLSRLVRAKYAEITTK